MSTVVRGWRKSRGVGLGGGGLVWMLMRRGWVVGVVFLKPPLRSEARWVCSVNHSKRPDLPQNAGHASKD